MEHKIYDIAVSYASEQRAYVERFVQRLRFHKLSVYYDRDAQRRMVGKILDQELHRIYIQESVCCVLFLSDAYAKKPVTRYESQIILSESIFRNQYMYIFKFDQISLPGLNRNFIYSNIHEFPEPERYADFMYEVTSGKKATDDPALSLHEMLSNGLKQIMEHCTAQYCYALHTEKQFGKLQFQLKFESSVLLQIQLGQLPGKDGTCLWMNRGARACDDHAYQGYITWVPSKCCYHLENRGLISDLVPELIFLSLSDFLDRINEEVQAMLGGML